MRVDTLKTSAVGGFVFIAYMSFECSSHLACAQTGPSILPIPMSNSFSGMGGSFGCRPTLLLESNTLLKGLQSTAASRPRPAYATIFGYTGPLNRAHIRTLRSTCIQQRIFQIDQIYPIRSPCIHPSLV